MLADRPSGTPQTHGSLGLIIPIGPVPFWFKRVFAPPAPIGYWLLAMRLAALRQSSYYRTDHGACAGVLYPLDCSRQIRLKCMRKI